MDIRRLFAGGVVLGIWVVSLAWVGPWGCGGGGSGGTSDSGGGAGASGGSGAALSVAEKVSVVDAQDGSSSALLAALGKVKASVSSLPADSDYNTDETFVFVEERSADAFDIVNEILCMMAQTKYDEMANAGDYLAQVDVAQCQSNNDDASEAGESSQNQSSSTNVPDYEFWTVNSYRADDSSPHVISVWVHEEAEEFEPSMDIDVKVVITESVSASNPYGLFHMNFRGHPPENADVTMMTGFLQTQEQDDGTILLQFYDHFSFGDEFSGLFEETEQVSLSRSPDGASGAGTIATAESGFFDGDRSEAFDIAFNDDLFFRRDASDEEVCLSRTDYDETVHRYNLYQDETSAAPGELVTRNSGFSIKYTDSQDRSYHGYIGYWGIHLPSEAGAASGDTVLKQDFDGPESENSGTPYEIFIAPGKLVKHVKKSLTLAEVAGIPLDMHQCDESSCTNDRVEWDSALQKLFKTGVRNPTNYVWQDVTPVEVTFDPEDFSFNFWSESLGGDGQVNLTNPDTGQSIALGNASVLTFHTNTTVQPGDSDIPAGFVCFNECPDPAKLDSVSPHFTKSSFTAGEDSFQRLAEETPPSSLVENTHYVAYTFDSDNMVLKQGGSDVAMDDDVESDFGVWSGPLIQVSDLSRLACDWDPNRTCPWKAREELSAFYTWDTGPNDWNKLALLRDPGTGNFLTFDPPLQVEYTHDTGTKYYLDYGGRGDLYGLPGKCVDMDSGQDTDCYDEEGTKHIRWVPEISIADGSTVRDSTSGEAYYVKAIDKEQRMQAVDRSQCVSAGLVFTSYELPDADLYEEPAIGDEPTVEGPPAVIGGVLQ